MNQLAQSIRLLSQESYADMSKRFDNQGTQIIESEGIIQNMSL